MTDFKVVLYGDYGVGKSALVLRLVRDEFMITPSTIGACYLAWKANYADGKQKVLSIWDTSGQERFNSLLPMYIRGSHAIIYCWDQGIPFNSKRASHMLDHARSLSKRSLFYLVITKMDMASETKNREAEKFAMEQDIKIFYTSSKTGEGIKEFFDTVASDLREMPMSDPPDILHVERVKQDSRYDYSKCCHIS